MAEDRLEERAKRLNFIKKSIEALLTPSEGKRLYVYDTKVRGLGLSVTSTGTKTFILYRKVEGRPERITLGHYPDLTIEQARRKATELNAAIAAGRNPARQRRAARAEMTLQELFELYLERYARVHKKSWRADVGVFNRYLGEWKPRKLSIIRKADVQALHSRIGKDHGIYAANRLQELLQTMFNRAADWGFEGPNPAKGIKAFREKSRERFLEADEMPRFFQAVAEELNTAVRDFTLIALLTGARRGNVLAMRWGEVNLERATWTIPETKTGVQHTVPLVPEAVAILEERKRTAQVEFVFPGNGRSGHLVEPRTAWLRILKRAGIKDLRIHDLRRTLGSWQAATGASLTVIGRTLAHKSVSTTAIYARLNLDPVRRSVETATRAMLAAGGMLPKAEVVEIGQGGKR